MVENRISVGGGVVFWTLAQWYHRDELAYRLATIGLPELTPPVRPILQCLRASLVSSYAGRDHLVQPLKDKGALEVVRIERAENRNEYQQVMVGRVTEDDAGNPKIVLTPFEQNTADVILGNFQEARGLISGEAVSELLTRYAGLLGGTRLRPVGGIYWLADPKLLQWQALTQEVEASVARGKCACYVIRHRMDSDAVRAVRDAIETEMAQEAHRIWDEVSSGELKERGLRNRQEEAERLAAKVADYELILNVALESSHSAIENCRNAAAAAALLASVEEPVA